MIEATGNIYVGPAGWSYPDWRGIVYPEPQPAHFSECTFLSRFVNTIEINSTFYKIPAPSTAQKWATLVKDNPRFRFCIKLWQNFTHSRKDFTDQNIAGFCNAIEPLYANNRLGALLIQFPWSYKKSRESLDYLMRLAQHFSRYNCVVEFRHASWLHDEVFSVLHEHHIGFANIDQPVIGQSIPLTNHVTSPIGYLRVHGRNYQNWFKQGAGRDERYNYLYSESEMDSWISNIQDMSNKSQATFVIFNNHFKGKAIVNSFQLIAKLTGQPISFPSILLQHYPDLQKFHDPGAVEQSQLSLF